MRLIDADAVLPKIDECLLSSMGRREAIITCYFAVKEAPTIDTKPIKHGKWMYRERTVAKNNVIKECFVNPGGYTVCYVDREMKVVKEPYCSECDWHGKEEFEETPFCPNCGAIMDL